MTPNRKLRTTAIAAMVAVSTVFAGVAPAVADNVQANSVNSNPMADGSQPAGLNIYDGSKLPKGTVQKDDRAFRKTVADVSAKIAKLGENEDTATLAAVFGNYEMDPELRKQEILGAVNETEQGALEALQKRLNEVTALLAEAAQNQADAQASLTDALNADLASKQAFKDLVDYINGLSASDRKALNALIANVNAEDRVSDTETKTGLAPIPTVTKTVTSEQAYNLITAIIAHRENVRNIRADKDSQHYVARDYAKALRALLESQLVTGFIAPYEASTDKLLSAQETDIVSFQVLLDQSRAQVLVLRIIQAKYAVAVRMIELYENDTLGENGILGLQTVKEAYYLALAGADKSITSQEAVERAQLKEADQATMDFFEGFPEDESNDYIIKDEEQLKFEARRKADAERAYKNIVADRVWQTYLEKAQLQDVKYFGDSAKSVKEREDAKQALLDQAKKAEAEADANAKKAAEEAKRAQAALDANNKLQQQLKEAQDKIKDLQNQPKPEPKEEPGKGDDNKFPIVPIAIVGVILAALAALAGHFPVIAGMLPKV